MNTQELVDQVVAHINAVQYVSFAGIRRLLEPHIPISGELAACSPENNNIILWAGMSQEFFDVIKELTFARGVYRHPSTPLVYMIDGALPLLPVAKNVKHKTPHWAPITFCSFPYKKSKRGAKA